MRAGDLEDGRHDQRERRGAGNHGLARADPRLVEQLFVGGHQAIARQCIGGSKGAPTGAPAGPLGAATIARMEGSGFGNLFGDPDDLQRKLGEFAEQMQGAQRLAWADNAIKLAVDLTVASINRVNIQGTTEQQAEQLRSVMAVVFPEAVTLVREAREGLQ